jgi:hypothetical protein
MFGELHSCDDGLVELLKNTTRRLGRRRFGRAVIILRIRITIRKTYFPDMASSAFNMYEESWPGIKRTLAELQQCVGNRCIPG